MTQLTLAHIHNSNLIEDIDDPDEDAQGIMAWAFLLECKELTGPVICHVQKIVTENQDDLYQHDKGEWRRHNIQVGYDPNFPHWPLVPHLMQNWLLDYKKLTPKEAHIRLEKIHPFADGNGRTGRLLMWWHERKLGKPCTLIKFEEREAYYAWFKKNR